MSRILLIDSNVLTLVLFYYFDSRSELHCCRVEIWQIICWSLFLSVNQTHWVNRALALVSSCHLLSVCWLCERDHNATEAQVLREDIFLETVTSQHNLLEPQHTDLGQWMKSMEIITKREKSSDNGEEKKRLALFSFHFIFKIVFPRSDINSADKESEQFPECRPSLRLVLKMVTMLRGLSNVKTFGL